MFGVYRVTYYYVAAVCTIYIFASSRAQLIHTCLDQIADRERCCTPSAFVKLSFTLRLNSVAGGCDPPSYLDQGVRLEVRRPGGSWEPIRFYTSTRETSSTSLVTLVQGSDTHIVDENDVQFPLYENQSSEPFTVVEYLCGSEYYTPGTEYRLLQRYSGSPLQGVDTWSLGNVAFTYSERGIGCSARIRNTLFRNFDGSALQDASRTPPSCEEGASQQHSVFLSDVTVVDGSAQRSVVITPEWWDADCSHRLMAGCELTGSCSASAIGDHMCSVGSGLQCLCQHPRLMGDSDTCADVAVGFNQTKYDVSEQDVAKLCVVLLQGNLTEDVSLQVNTHSGSANEGTDFAGLSRTVTLTPTVTQQCVSVMIEDDSVLEETESLTVSLSLTGAQDSVQLSQPTAPIMIVDNDRVVIQLPSNTVREGESTHITLAAPQGSEESSIGLTFQTVAGSAADPGDYVPRSFTYSGVPSEFAAGLIIIKKDGVWEGYENLTVIFVVDGTAYSRSMFIIDNNSVTVGFNASDYTVSEGDGSGMVCVTLQGSIGDGAELYLTVSTQEVPGSAQEVLDYRGLSNIVTFSSTSSDIQCLPLVVVNDRVLEDDESLNLFLSLPRPLNNVAFAQRNAVVHITDNDVVGVGFMQSVYTASEHDMSAMVCVAVKQGSLGIFVNLSLTTHNASAQGVLDFTGLMSTVNLTPTVTQQCVSVMIEDDSVLEKTESLTVSLSLTGASDSVYLSQPTATIVITDDDELMVGFTMSSYTVSEAEGEVEVCVRVVSGQLGTDITLRLVTVSGTAVDGNDYTGLTRAVTLTPTVTQQCVSVMIEDDSVLEETESLTVSLSLTGAPDGVQLSQQIATVIVTDEDGLTVGFSMSSYTVSEAEGEVVVCVRVVSGQLGTDITLQLDTVSGTAVDEDDYTALTRAVTLTPTVTQQCVSVMIEDDSVLEETESLTVSLSLTGAPDGVQLSQQIATVVVTDEDGLTVGFSMSSYTVSEAEGEVEVCVRVVSGQLGTDITLQLDTVSGTAVDEDDYTALTRAVTLTPTVTQQCVSVMIEDDSVLEETESLTVSLSLTGAPDGVQLSQQIATVVVTDEDGLTVGFSMSSYTVSEAEGEVEVCVRVVSGQLGTDITLQLDTVSGTAVDGNDYTALTRAVTLTPTVTQQCVSVMIEDDSVLEETESLTVSLSLTGAPDGVRLSQQIATVVVTDEDGLTVGFSMSSYTVSEAEGEVEVCVRVVSGQLGTDITLQLDTVSGTAVDEDDYTALTRAVTLTPTVTQQCVSVMIEDDSVLEETESLTVSLSLTGAPDGVQLSQQIATVVVTDEDGLTVGFSMSSYTVSEAEGEVEVCVRVVSGQLGTDITLQLETVSGTAVEDDYTALTRAVTLTPAVTQQCVLVMIEDDSVLEETESLTVSLSLTGAPDGVQLSEQTATIVITNDDGLQVGFTMNSYTASEAEEQVEVCVRVVSGQLGTDITLQLETVSETAVDESDYTALTRTLTLTSTVTQRCVSIMIVDDLVLEETETLTVSLSLTGAPNSVQTARHAATIVITNDDELTVGFTTSSYTVSETEGEVEVCVGVVGGQLGTDITLQLDTHSGTAVEEADYTALRRAVTLHPAVTQQCVSVMIEDDSVLEETETLTVSLSLTGAPDGVQISQQTATIVITNDDGLTVGFTVSSYTVSEAEEEVEVCVRVVRGQLGIDITLQLETVNGTAVDEGDYTALTRAVTLTPTVTQQCVLVMIEDDSVLEETESLTVSLSLTGAPDSVQLSEQTATIVITNDDELRVAFTMSSYTASEAEEVEVCVRVVSGQLGTDITLQLDTVSGTAVDEDDYTALTRAVTLTPTVTQQCVSVMIEDDSVLEETESLTVSLSLTGAPDSVHLFQQTATIVITDNDKLTVGFTMSSYTVSEAEEEVEVCLRVVSGQLGTDITLQLETISGTAVDEDDYTALTRAVTFTPTVTQQCVSVMIEDDSVFEETESLMVSLSLTGAPDGVQLSQQTAAIVITNDDEVEVEFTNSIYTTNEADTEVEVCVSVVSGQLGANITLQLDSVSETARENVDYEVVSHSVTLTPTTPEACVAIIIMDDKAVELNENLRVSLSQVGKLDGVQIPKDPATVSIQDDDMAMIALEKTRHTVQGGGGGEVGTIEVVDLCVETNSTLERTFVLSVIIIRTSANTTKNTSHIAEVTLTIELHPGDTRACVSLNVSSVDETISFLVQSDELMIANPNGTIIVEPSFDEINNLLQGDNVDIGKVVELLDGIVNDLIANGQTASPEFTGTFVGVVSDVLTISNGQSSDQTERKRRESDDPGTSLLITLDKFALRSFDSSLGVFEDDNLRLQVNDEIGDSSGEPTVTGISGTEDESIDIPTQILQNINSTVTVASYYLRNVGGLLPDTLPEVSGAELVSSVLSSALGCGDSPCDPVVNASEPVRISLRHRKRQGLSEEARCVFYDLNNDSWSEAGCYVNETESADDLTVCYCNHLTHFAVILSPKNSVDEQNAFNLRIIGYVGITISLVCLLLTVVIFCCLKPLWSMRNYIHVNLCVNLIIAQLLFVTGVDKTRYQIVCQSIAVVLHYSFLVTFMWMLMEGVVLYVALVKVFVTKPRRYIISFTVISYGAPLLYMGVVVPLGFLLSDEPHYGGDICWLTSSTHFIWTFIAPVILIILINIGFFFMAIYIIWKQQRRKKLSNSQMNKAKHWLKVSVSLLVIMGISWIVGVLTFHEALLFVSYIFTIVVAFQGALIFILFVVLSKQVRHTLKKWLVRNVINKSSYLSEHFSEFTRSTQAGHTQSHSHSSSHGDKSTLSHGIQLGTFMALPEKSTSISELEKRIEATAPTSLPPTNTPPSSPIPSPQHPTPPSHSPTPQILSEDCKKEDVEMAPCATDSGTDKDSGRSSPDTDAIDTPPPVTLQQHTHVPTVTSKQPTFTEHKLPSTDMH